MREEFKAAVLRIRDDLADIAEAIAPFSVTPEGKAPKLDHEHYMYWRVHHAVINLQMNLKFAAKHENLAAVGVSMLFLLLRNRIRAERKKTRIWNDFFLCNSNCKMLSLRKRQVLRS